MDISPVLHPRALGECLTSSGLCRSAAVRSYPSVVSRQWSLQNSPEVECETVIEARLSTTSDELREKWFISRNSTLACVPWSGRHCVKIPHPGNSYKGCMRRTEGCLGQSWKPPVPIHPITELLVIRLHHPPSEATKQRVIHWDLRRGMDAQARGEGWRTASGGSKNRRHAAGPRKSAPSPDYM